MLKGEIIFSILMWRYCFNITLKDLQPCLCLCWERLPSYRLFIIFHSVGQNTWHPAVKRGLFWFMDLRGFSPWLIGSKVEIASRRDWQRRDAHLMKDRGQDIAFEVTPFMVSGQMPPPNNTFSYELNNGWTREWL